MNNDSNLLDYGRDGAFAGSKVWTVSIPVDPSGLSDGGELTVSFLNNNGNVVSCGILKNDNGEYRLFIDGTESTANDFTGNARYKPRKDDNLILEVNRIENRDYLLYALKHPVSLMDWGGSPGYYVYLYGSTARGLSGIDDIATPQISAAKNMTLDLKGDNWAHIWPPTRKEEDIKIESAADALFTVSAWKESGFMDYLDNWSCVSGNDEDGYNLSVKNYNNAPTVKAWLTSRPVTGIWPSPANGWISSATVKIPGGTGMAAVVMTNDAFVRENRRSFDCKDRVRTELKFDGRGGMTVKIRANTASASQFDDLWGKNLADENVYKIESFDSVTVKYTRIINNVRVDLLDDKNVLIAGFTVNHSEFKAALIDIAWIALEASGPSRIEFKGVKTSWSKPDFDLASFAKKIMDKMSDRWLINGGEELAGKGVFTEGCNGVFSGGWHLKFDETGKTCEIWPRYQYISAIVTYLEYLKLNHAVNIAEIEKYEEVLHNESRFVINNVRWPELFRNWVLGGADCWATDDTAWALLWLSALAERESDPEHKKFLLDSAWDLFVKITSFTAVNGQAKPWAFKINDGDADILIWYHNTWGMDKAFTSSYSAGIAVAGLKLAELDSDSGRKTKYMADSRAIYTGIKNFLGRNDGLYYCDGGFDGLHGKNAPYMIREGGSVTFFAADMGMAALALRLGDAEQAVKTLKGIARFETKRGAYVNGRDAWTDGVFAGDFAKTLMKSDDVAQYLKDIHADRFVATAYSISLNKSGEGILSAHWFQENGWNNGETNGTQVSTNGTTAHMVAAALLAEHLKKCFEITKPAEE